MDLASLLHEGTNTKTCKSALILRILLEGLNSWENTCGATLGRPLKQPLNFLCLRLVSAVLGTGCLAHQVQMRATACIDQAPEEIACDVLLCCSMVTHMGIAPSVWGKSCFLWS